mmetsp:Transcript_4999/g.15962  ORF Transcript_4999/g.15962 Transcript_4999/m.15962 type:complete len:252 (-) Transcript_4999:461-1216(-)
MRNPPRRWNPDPNLVAHPPGPERVVFGMAFHAAVTVSLKPVRCVSRVVHNGLKRHVPDASIGIGLRDGCSKHGHLPQGCNGGFSFVPQHSSPCIVIERSVDENLLIGLPDKVQPREHRQRAEARVKHRQLHQRRRRQGLDRRPSPRRRHKPQRVGRHSGVARSGPELKQPQAEHLGDQHCHPKRAHQVHKVAFLTQEQQAHEQILQRPQAARPAQAPPPPRAGQPREGGREQPHHGHRSPELHNNPGARGS